MKLTATILAALIATSAHAVAQDDGDYASDDMCGECGSTPAPADPTPPAQDNGDFIRPDEVGNWITGPIDWRCRNEPVCEGGRR